MRMIEPPGSPFTLRRVPYYMKARKGHLMDIFQYREDLIGDYSAYVKGFLEVRDADVEQFITSRLDGGFLWPEPLVQLNPAFVSGNYR